LSFSGAQSQNFEPPRLPRMLGIPQQCKGKTPLEITEKGEIFA